ncbi:NAD(P)H-binding protein [Chelativorans sp. ZYF759]|uniref:NAD-binding protein n=1 Tax=Chelativorans sp. ZYF759 TaxID=2692213 RepID=UPI00145E9684|nr:NAD-binding protein [Chelativorans sp. ZYF759]NMG38318.1 NAD(P)H-binding protein [Chelativorans sp. ZYF759]
MGNAPAQVLVIAGYGHVGKLIARELLAKPELGVWLAGRNREKVTQAAAALGCDAAVVDIAARDTWEPAVAEASVVVMCIDAPDNSFAAHVLSKGEAICRHLRKSGRD